MKFINRVILLLLFCFLPLVSAAQAETTTLRGAVIDGENGEAVPYASVVLDGVKPKQVALSDENGIFFISLPKGNKAHTLQISSVGYKAETVELKTPQNRITVRLQSQSFVTDSIVITATSRRKKSNPALEFVRRVIAAKYKNSPDVIDFYQAEKYEKTILSITGITSKLQRRKILTSLRPAFDYVDTQTQAGDTLLPVLIVENLSDVFHQKRPHRHTETEVDSKMSEFHKFIDNEGVRAYVQTMFRPIDIYKDNVLFFNRQFLSPLSESAPAFYHFALAGSTFIDGDSCVQVVFTPKFRGDMLFDGKMSIAADGSYAVRRIELSVGSEVNLNWVRDAHINIELQRSPGGIYLPLTSETSINFRLTRKSRMGLLGQHKVSYRNFFEPTTNPTHREISTSRHKPLSKQEENAYTANEKIQQATAYKWAIRLVNAVVTDYWDAGYLEIGTITGIYASNPVEGTRIKLGARTTNRLSERFFFDGHLAYTFGDRLFKGYAGTTFSLNKNSVWKFPQKTMHVSYRDEAVIPGLETFIPNEDQIIWMFKRKEDDKRFYNRTLKVEHSNEFRNNFSYTIGYFYKEQRAGGNLWFNYSDYLEGTNSVNVLRSSEAYLKLRYAPGEKFYTGRRFRSRITATTPVFTLEYNVGTPFLGNDYTYHRLRFKIEKRFNLSLLGYTNMWFEASKIFGKAPFPLLDIHRGNETHSYKIHSYNMMNYLEFVSDQSLSLNLEHCFNGFFFNKIPLVRRLKFREYLTVKILWGGISERNNPARNGNLFRLPTAADGTALTFAPGPVPYIEGSVGIGNIFKLFRIDFVNRFTYRNHPAVPKFGVRMRLRVEL